MAVNAFAVYALAVNGALFLDIVSKSILKTLCSSKKYLIYSLSVLSEVLEIAAPEGRDPSACRFRDLDPLVYAA